MVGTLTLGKRSLPHLSYVHKIIIITVMMILKKENPLENLEISIDHFKRRIALTI